jgi:hypothetical protein
MNLSLGAAIIGAFQNFIVKLLNNCVVCDCQGKKKVWIEGNLFFSFK